MSVADHDPTQAHVRRAPPPDRLRFRNAEREPARDAGVHHRAGTGAGGARFDLATPVDDAEVRRVLRDNPMPGPVRLSFTREPDAAIAAAVEGDAHQTIVGRRPGDGAGLFGLGMRSVRDAVVNGEVVRLGYLGGLRLDPDYRANPRVILRGYERFRDSHTADGRTRLYLTSILVDNRPARRLLEANLRGMPTYRFVSEFVTVVMTVRGRRAFHRTGPRPARVRPARSHQRPCKPGGTKRPADFEPASDIVSGDAARLVDAARLLTADAGRHNFRPVWSPQSLGPEAAPGLRPCDFRFVLDADDRPVACAALWDQRAFRQTVVHSYAPWLGACRPAVNLAAIPLGRPRLPPPGATLASAYVSHLAAATVGHTVSLIAALLADAADRSLDYLVAGFPAGDPRLAAVRRAFPGRALCSRLYLVYWPDGRPAADAVVVGADGRLPFPEVALL